MPLRSKYKRNQRPLYPQKKRKLKLHARKLNKHPTKYRKRRSYREAYKIGNADAAQGWPSQPLPEMLDNQDAVSGYYEGYLAALSRTA